MKVSRGRYDTEGDAKKMERRQIGDEMGGEDVDEEKLGNKRKERERKM